jgi:hypothetical protein
MAGEAAVIAGKYIQMIPKPAMCILGHDYNCFAVVGVEGNRAQPRV